MCAACGLRFTDGNSSPARSSPGGPRLPRWPRVRWWPVLIAVLAAAFVVGSGAAIIALRVGHHPRTEAAQGSGESTQLTSPSGQGSSAPDSPPPSSTEPSSPAPSSPAPSSAGPVAIGPGASQDANAPAVAAFLDRYFTAINARDYQTYSSLLSPALQQGQTEQQFASGYRSTVDSAETLVGISTAANGDLVAAVTFTSHQNPADSPDHQHSCTDWTISLFLQPGSGGGYLIDPPPSSYHASYQACP